jgi:NADH-quinone oxidoreductase subunit L
MTVPLLVLAVLTLVAGGALGVSASPWHLGHVLAPVFPAREEAHGLLVPVLSAVAALAGVAVAWARYARRPVRAEELGRPRNALHALVFHKYYVDELYDAVFVRPGLGLSTWCARVFDAGVIDGAVNGLGRAVAGWALALRRVQTGLTMNYALGMLVGAVALVAFLLSR